MRAYRKKFDEIKYISFWIKDDELLEKTIKFGNSLKKELDSEALYNEKYNVIQYNGKININSHHNKITKEGSQFICSSVI